MTSIGDLVRQRRTALSLTQRELAVMCECTTGSIANIEHNRQRPGPALRRLLSQHLDIPLESLAESRVRHG